MDEIECWKFLFNSKWVPTTFWGGSISKTNAEENLFLRTLLRFFSISNEPHDFYSTKIKVKNFHIYSIQKKNKEHNTFSITLQVPTWQSITFYVAACNWWLCMHKTGVITFKKIQCLNCFYLPTNCITLLILNLC